VQVLYPFVGSVQQYAQLAACDFEKLAGEDRESVEGKDRDASHLTRFLCRCANCFALSIPSRSTMSLTTSCRGPPLRLKNALDCRRIKGETTRWRKHEHQ
jgi:hypothetical protein